jgi:23S rRNA (uracil1939-C5)-methyltransferase
VITGTIESIAFGGNGILKDNGLVVFVPFTAPQDQATIALTQKKKNYARGSLLVLNSPGPDRTEPACPHFGSCGGCQFQHIAYPAQLKIKQRFLEDALQRIAKLAIPIPPIVPAPHPYHYRCHITLRMKPRAQGFQLGYTGHDNTTFIPITTCPLFCPKQDTILADAQHLVSKLHSTGINQATLRLFKHSDGYLLAFQFSPHCPANIELCEEALRTYPRIQAILIQSPLETHTFGTPQCHTASLGIHAAYSPYGFVQNYPEQRDAMYQKILDDLPSDAAKILDLYCGIGMTSLLFASQGKTVIGIESNPECIAMAEQNAKHNALTNVSFHRKKAEESAPILATFQPDSVLCNPPREGLDPSVIEALTAHRIPYIQYLSCNPATLARDLKLLIQSGYRVEKLQGFDMFPQTTHVETLVLLRFVQ